MDRTDPPVAADERSTLLAFLDYQRATMLGKAEGLTAAQLSQRLAPSTLTLGGLLKHLALVEDDWIQSDFLGGPQVEPWASAPFDDDRDWELHSAEHDAPDELRALYVAACERTRRVVAEHDLDDLSVHRNRDGEQWSLRWILCHLIEETARHNGHADLLRESIDGAVGE